jgi:hypothetical protein
MRSQARRISEETEAQRAVAEAEFEIALASRRGEAERQEAEQHSKQLVSNAQKNADQIVARAKAQAAQAKASADQLIADTKTELERHRAAARREVDELNRQKDAITASLEQLRRLISGHAPAVGPPSRGRPAGGL